VLTNRAAVPVRPPASPRRLRETRRYRPCASNSAAHAEKAGGSSFFTSAESEFHDASKRARRTIHRRRRGLGRALADWLASRALDEAHHRVAERRRCRRRPRCVPRIGELDETPRAGTVARKMFDAFGADDVGQFSADQQDRDREVLGRVFEVSRCAVRGSSPGLVMKAGSQCQKPASVPESAGSFFSPSGPARLLAVGEVGGGRRRRALFQRFRKPSRLPIMEIADAGTAALLESRHHVDEHQLGDFVRAGAGRRPGSRSNPPHAGTDDRHRPADLLEHVP